MAKQTTMTGHIWMAIARTEQEEEVTAWQLWNDNVRKMMGVSTDEAQGSVYRNFKRVLGEMARRNWVVGAGTGRLNKQHFTFTPRGIAWWATEGRLEHLKSTDDDDAAEVREAADDRIGKRLKPDTTPRLVWEELMDRYMRGEVDIAFLRPKDR